MPKKRIILVLFLTVVIGISFLSVSCPEVVETLLRVTQPQFDPLAGQTHEDAVDVTLTSTTAGATIRYTIDGSTPTVTEGTLYSAPIHITTTTTIKAIAYKEGMLDSLVSIGTFTITTSVARVNNVLFSPMMNTVYLTAQDVIMSCGTQGATIRYTTDGSDPTATTGTIYTGPVHIEENTSFKAIAYKEGMAASIVTEAPYYVNLPKVATPTFSSWQPGSFGDFVYISLGCATSGATILYTLDDSEPTRDNDTALVYTERFGIYNTHTIKAFAYKEGLRDSEILSGRFWPTKVDDPDYSHPGGTHRDKVPLEITTQTIGATILYKMNDSDWTEYEGPINLDTEGEYNFVAQAFLDGLNDSDITGKTLTLSWLPADPPQFNPGAGNFDEEVVVTISSTSPGAKIRYTYDGSLPTPDHGIEYTDPIRVTSSALVKAVAYGDILDPTVSEAGYGIIGPAGGFVIMDKGETSGETLVYSPYYEAFIKSGHNDSGLSWRYIEVAPVDFTAVLPGSWAEGLIRDPSYHMFGCYDEDACHIEGTKPDIGCGYLNSNLINAAFDPETDFGARACLEFTSSVSNQYHSDWVLPSLYEMQLIAQRLGNGGLRVMPSISYLSSTLDLGEFGDEDQYYHVNGATGGMQLFQCDGSYVGAVRPIRLY